MITQEFRDLFKKNLGENYAYSNEVLKNLKEKGITNRNNKPHSKAIVRMVFSGERENIDIETAIMEVYYSEIEKIQRHKQLQKKIKGKGKAEK